MKIGTVILIGGGLWLVYKLGSKMRANNALAAATTTSTTGTQTQGNIPTIAVPPMQVPAGTAIPGTSLVTTADTGATPPILVTPPPSAIPDGAMQTFNIVSPSGAKTLLAV